MNRTCYRWTVPVLFGFLLWAFVGHTFAQETRGTIQGRILDNSASAIPGASVSAVNVATKVATSAKTDDLGTYNLPYLLPGCTP